MTSFHCFRNDKHNHRKCEWNEGGLRDFAAQFNKIYGENYNLSKCLDISSPAEPEVLLEAPGSQPMVIERKQIPYPDDYYKVHQHLHDFYEQFLISYKEKLEPKLPQEQYTFSTNINGIRNSNKVADVTEQIIVQILDYLENHDDFDSISSNIPFPWSFRYASVDECDNDSTTSGIRVYLWEGDDWKMIKEAQEAEQKIAEKLEQKYLPAADKKFQKYPDCLKVLVVEMCGSPWTLPGLDSLKSIIKSTNIPHSIDQIWLAVSLDELDTSIAYHQVINHANKYLD
jgi:hypothetical protein